MNQLLSRVVHALRLGPVLDTVPHGTTSADVLFSPAEFFHTDPHDHRWVSQPFLARIHPTMVPVPHRGLEYVRMTTLLEDMDDFRIVDFLGGEEGIRQHTAMTLDQIADLDRAGRLSREARTLFYVVVDGSIAVVETEWMPSHPSQRYYTTPLQLGLGTRAPGTQVFWDNRDMAMLASNRAI